VDQERFRQARPAAAEGRRKILKAFEGDPNVVGGAFGRRILHDEAQDTPAVIIYVARKESEDRLRPSHVLPRSVEAQGQTVAVDVVETGFFYAHHYDQRERPAPLGVSIGHFAITAGTLGCLVRDRTDGELCILSNNHVLANENDARTGDAIYQPGPSDGGTTEDRIGELKRFVPMSFESGTNHVDAAIARVIDEATVADHFKNVDYRPSPERRAVGLLFAGSCSRTTMNPIDRVLADLNVELTGGPGSTTTVQVTDAVDKIGRTTEYSNAAINEIDGETWVNYDTGRAYFVDQLMAGAMSAGGDSGSVVMRGGPGGPLNGDCLIPGVCATLQVFDDVLDLPLSRETAAAKEARDRYLRQTSTGAYLTDLFYVNEERIAERARATAVAAEDKSFAHALFAHYLAAFRLALADPSQVLITDQMLVDAQAALKASASYLEPHEVDAGKELLKVAKEAEGRTAAEALQMLDDQKVNEKVRKTLEKVKFLEQPPKR
jgi:hypothetical protein